MWQETDPRTLLKVDLEAWKLGSLKLGRICLLDNPGGIFGTPVGLGPDFSLDNPSNASWKCICFKGISVQEKEFKTEVGSLFRGYLNWESHHRSLSKHQSPWLFILYVWIMCELVILPWYKSFQWPSIQILWKQNVRTGNVSSFCMSNEITYDLWTWPRYEMRSLLLQCQGQRSRFNSLPSKIIETFPVHTKCFRFMSGVKSNVLFCWAILSVPNGCFIQWFPS